MTFGFYVCVANLMPIKFNHFNNFFSIFQIYLLFQINISLYLLFFQLFLSRFDHFVGSMPTFMTDDILFSYILMFSFLVRLFAAFL